MKYLFLFLFLLTGLTANTQIVNIPDSLFKSQLLNNNNVNTNQDTEIQVSEALMVTNLTATGYDLTGIREFVNLQYLNCSNGFLTNLDLNGLTQLQSLNCQSNLLTSMNFTGCVNLATLHCNDNRFSMLDVRNLPNLEFLSYASSFPMFAVIAEGAPRLKSVYICAQIEYVNLKDCDSVTSFECPYGDSIETLDISGADLLSNVFLLGPVQNLIARNCPNLTEINLGNIRNSLDVTECTNLRNVDISRTKIPSLDFSSCFNLQSVRVEYDTNINHAVIINIKNGSQTSLIPWGADTVNICADDFEFALLDSIMMGVPGVMNISSACSFFPGGNYNTIKGKTIIDYTNNGCGAGDGGMANVPIRIIDGSGNSVIRYTAPSGNYAHYPYAGNFTLTPYSAYPYFDITPVSANVVFDTANSLIDTVDFCISANGVHNDLEITFLPSGAPARPGFDAGYQLVYKNRGTTILSGSVLLNFDNSKMNLGYASTPVNTQTAGHLIWNYNNLLPFERRTINMSFNLLPPPVNNINDTLVYVVNINPIANDETPSDNSFILPQRVIGSYDPNDKQCLEGVNISITEIDKFLHYIIHFQNLGTDTAFNIVVADTLSSKLDWDSFEFISSSHTCDIQQRNGKMEFFFQNINLPHSAINEPASHGFVSFKIKPKSTVVIGDSLNNRAAIYFDFNLPVITNTATTIVSPVGPVPVKLEYFSAVAKGNINILNWKASCSSGTSTFSIERSGDGIHYTKIGNITAIDTRCLLPFGFTDEHPLTGKNYYRLKISDADGISYYSKVVLIGYDKAGFEIVTVTSNQQSITAYFNSEKQEFIHLKVVATDGRIIYADSKTIPVGSSQLEIPLKNIAAGVYTLIAYTDQSRMVSRRFMR